MEMAQKCADIVPLPSTLSYFYFIFRFPAKNPLFWNPAHSIGRAESSSWSNFQPERSTFEQFPGENVKPAVPPFW